MQSGIEQIRTANISQMFPESGSGNISREVEDEANSYFQKIYNVPPHPTLTIDQVLEKLKKFQVSYNLLHVLIVLLYVITRAKKKCDKVWQNVLFLCD